MELYFHCPYVSMAWGLFKYRDTLSYTRTAAATTTFWGRV
jgi:hypothetical protein